MITLKLVKNEEQELARIRELFVSAFPVQERPPFFFLKCRAKQNVDWWNIYQDEIWAGFFYVIKKEDLIYVCFFAIAPSMRKKGCGTEAMKQLIRQYSGKRLFLAIEPVDPKAKNYQERVKRKNFYQRCGLIPLGENAQEGWVVYELLGTGSKILEKEYKSVMEPWLGWPLKYFIPVRILS